MDLHRQRHLLSPGQLVDNSLDDVSDRTTTTSATAILVAATIVVAAGRTVSSGGMFIMGNVRKSDGALGRLKIMIYTRVTVAATTVIMDVITTARALPKIVTPLVMMTKIIAVVITLASAITLKFAVIRV